MLLAVDIGNTSTKFGIFDGEYLLSKFSIPTNRTFNADDLKSHIGDKQSISNAVICSVVPEKELSLKAALHNTLGVEALTVRNDVDLGLKINYQPLSTLGTDRLVNSFAATEKYGLPCIVCSIGTATTFDFVSKTHEFLGGIITPGMKTMARALHLNTAKLPEIEIEKPNNVLGHTTEESIRSGIFYGHIATVEGLIRKIKKESGDDSKVIATGGFASLIAENTSLIDIVDENLLLEGLRLLYGRINN